MSYWLVGGKNMMIFKEKTGTKGGRGGKTGKKETFFTVLGGKNIIFKKRGRGKNIIFWAIYIHPCNY